MGYFIALCMKDTGGYFGPVGGTCGYGRILVY